MNSKIIELIRKMKKTNQKSMSKKELKQLKTKWDDLNKMYNEDERGC